MWPCSDLNVPRPPAGSPNLSSKVNAERGSQELYTTVFAKLRIIHMIQYTSLHFGEAEGGGGGGWQGILQVF